MDHLLDAIAERRWLPVATIVIGLVVRLLKSDTKIPIDIPPRARVWLAFGLGIVSGILEKVITGVGWEPAILGGLGAAVVAIAGHDAFIASIRGGKELPIPGLILPGARPAPSAPITIPPEPPLPRINTDTEPPSS